MGVAQKDIDIEAVLANTRINDAVAAVIEQALHGDGTHGLPVFTAPPLPDGVAPVSDGALERVFRAVRTAKFRPRYTDAIAFFQRADHALYGAKEAGKGQVVAASLLRPETKRDTIVAPPTIAPVPPPEEPPRRLRVLGFPSSRSRASPASPRSWMAA